MTTATTPTAAGTTDRDLVTFLSVLPTAEGWHVDDALCDDGTAYINVREPRGQPWMVTREGGAFVITPPHDNQTAGPTLGLDDLPHRPRTAREAAEVIRREVLGVLA